jgi:hypothetical protein
MSRIDSGVRSTRAREVIISLTYNPAPYSRHSLRNAVFVMPAMGARTTGESSRNGPMASCVGLRVAEGDIAHDSPRNDLKEQTKPERRGDA